ncbi:hypothetical protein WAI453_013071 [Rhynchosporium graminicola]
MKGSETCKSFISVRVLNADDSTTHRGTYSYDRGSPASKESEPLSREVAEIGVEPDASEATEIPEAKPMPLAEEEDLYLSKKKKDKKKSKVGSKRASFGEPES